MALESNLNSMKIPAREQVHKLPSGCYTYGDSLPKELAIKPYSFVTEGYLISNRKWHDKMKAILEKVTVFPEGFDLDQLLVADAYFIFACARALTYGEHYTFTTKCPACGHEEKHTFSVPEELPVHIWFNGEDPIKPKKGSDVNATENVSKRGGSMVDDKFFTVELPYIKDAVQLQFPTLGGERLLGERFATLEKSGATNVTEEQEIARIASHIHSVNGGMPDTPFEAEDYVKAIEGVDMVALADAITEKECGISFTGEIECENCGHIYPNELPLRADFFRRSRS